MPNLICWCAKPPYLAAYCAVGGGLFDASYPNSPLRRARVQGVPGISSTIMAGASEVYLFENVIEVKDDLQNHTP